jgi:hypothetical protein
MLGYGRRNRNPAGDRKHQHNRCNGAGPPREARACLSGDREVPGHQRAEKATQHFEPFSFSTLLTASPNINMSIDYQHIC